MSALTKTTHVYATRQIALECDVYQAAHYPKGSPVLLFFHSGGLVAGGRQDIPPWLIQTCMANKWPVVSASYRLLPQVKGDSLLEDAKAAYRFARTLGVEPNAPEREVIATGSSAGFFLATLIAHHLTPKPLALLASSGIPTFRHTFFNSPALSSPDSIDMDEVEHILAEPISVGTCPSSVFDVDMLLPSGQKNPNYDPSATPPVARKGQHPHRGLLYQYFLYRNELPGLVVMVDRGFDQVTDPAKDEVNPKLEQWPYTILLQGDNDEDVDKDVCVAVSNALGNRAKLLMAKGQGHRFGRTNFLDDEGPGMDEIRTAVQLLADVVHHTTAAKT